ncbi:DUF262 domain-containing protein [Pedobacter sp. FW305-3-2-15-E-R2A2]|uniref:DUF262 domain-containing protein n=1 Tax=Pedobacter sp. FW305-3-2-15-E-R2A2 TaxID=3140251 RepID=UPI003140BD4E
MNSAKYSIKDFFTFQNLEQILVPEIQRDYVWKIENVKKLLNSFIEDQEKWNETKESYPEEMLQKLSPKMRESLLRELENSKVFCNIGFIYGYHDPEQISKYILIDGQQRLTTIFLLLLAVHINENETELFRRRYFPYEQLKVDYKVRENSHVFLYEFVKFLLNGGSISEIKNQYWYFNSYKADQTICSLIDNYAQIATFLSNTPLSKQFVEDQIEIFYFDISESEQGEDLYLYMNSRGESVQPNENIKAQLLEHVAESEKNTWGETWEKWQSFFWIKRGERPSADKGFDEFLKWIKSVEIITNQEYPSLASLETTLRAIREKNKITPDGLSLQLIHTYYEALMRVLEKLPSKYFTASFFSTDTTAADYIRILPVMMYSVKFPEATERELLRVVRFYYNIANFDNISKSPYQAFILSVQLTDRLIEDGHNDITDLTRYIDMDTNQTILTPEEIKKLLAYGNDGPDFDRQELEELFWEAEDFPICNGKISLLWTCIDYSPIHSGKDLLDRRKFDKYFATFKQLFSNADDMMRRALLSKGDYSEEDGYSPTLQAPRWSFGQGANKWREIFERQTNMIILKEFLKDYIKREESENLAEQQSILQQIIDEYKEENIENSWRYHFIKNPKILNYCSKKQACFRDESIASIFLLEKQKASGGFKELRKMIK